MPSVNTLAIAQYCSHAYLVNSEEIRAKLSVLRCSYDGALSELGSGSSIYEYIESVSYLIVQTYLSEHGAMVKDLEAEYRSILLRYAGDNEEYIRPIAHGWLCLIDAFYLLDEVLVDAEYSYSCMPVDKTFCGEKFHTFIDLYVLKNGKSYMYNFLPRRELPYFIEATTNIKTNVCLEYLNEANLFPDVVVGLYFSDLALISNTRRPRILSKRLNTSRFNHDKILKNMARANDVVTGINPCVCRVCPANDICNPLLSIPKNITRLSED